MEIIYKLPLPEEMCSHIFHFACRSPHTAVGVKALKHRLCLFNLRIPENDEEVTCINRIGLIGSVKLARRTVKQLKVMLRDRGLSVSGCKSDLVARLMCDLYNGPWTVSHILSIDLSFYACFRNLMRIYLFKTRTSGDIWHLCGLKKLSVISLYGVSVTGDIASLASLPDLSVVDLSGTRVTGNIMPLSVLEKLTVIRLTGTSATGDSDEFHRCRDDAGLRHCRLHM